MRQETAVGVAETEFPSAVLCHAAVGEEAAPWLALRRGPEELGVVSLREGEDLEQPRAAGRVRGRQVGRLGIDAGAAGEQLDRATKVGVMEELDEVEDVSALTAAVASPAPPVLVDVEGGCPFLVEGAEATSQAPDALQAHVLADDVDDVDAGLDGRRIDPRDGRCGEWKSRPPASVITPVPKALRVRTPERRPQNGSPRLGDTQRAAATPRSASSSGATTARCHSRRARTHMTTRLCSAQQLRHQSRS